MRCAPLCIYGSCSDLYCIANAVRRSWQHTFYATLKIELHSVHKFRCDHMSHCRLVNRFNYRTAGERDENRCRAVRIHVYRCRASLCRARQIDMERKRIMTICCSSIFPHRRWHRHANSVKCDMIAKTRSRTTHIIRHHRRGRVWRIRC